MNRAIIRHFGWGFLIGLAQVICGAVAIAGLMFSAYALRRGENLRGITDIALAAVWFTFIFRLQRARVAR